MERHWTAAAVLTLLVSGCVARTPPPAATYRLPTDIRVRVGTTILDVPFEDYVLGSALSEVSPVGESIDTAARVFEVQAVLARTYAAASLWRHRAEGFNLCDTTHCQVYQPGRIQTSRFTALAREAVTRTRGQILMYAGAPAEALFHADCGGHTADASDVWGNQSPPYLLGAADEVPTLTHRDWQLNVPTAQLERALNAAPESQIGRRLTSITVMDRDSSGRATRLELRGDRTVTLRGERFRAILNRVAGDRAIRSTKFTVSRSSSAFTFDGSGWGHGVGLCQIGAAARARRGDSLQTILTIYFPGARLARTS